MSSKRNAPPGAVEGHPIWHADHGRWNLPAVRALLRKVLAQDTLVETCTLALDDPAVGARILLIARKPLSHGHADPVVLLVIEAEPRLVEAQPANLVEAPS